jgi:hypothetical protein
MEVISKNVHWLLPEEPSPCDIFLYFRGQYPSALTAGQAVSLKLLEKLAKAHCSHVFIRRDDEAAWNDWIAQRSPRAQAQAVEPPKEDATKALYGNKRAELLSYVQKSVSKRTEGDRALDEAFQQALELLQKIVRLPTLDWYFQKFHEPPTLFHHCGRVSFALAIFLQMRNLGTPEERESICFSALIHELEGDLETNAKAVVSRQTIALLSKNQHPVPREVLEFIETHDEVCTGKGFPNNLTRVEIPALVRIFTLFNHFDAYRARSTGTRRARFERTKEAMTARQADYDPGVWPLFWEFWETRVEAVT